MSFKTKLTGAAVAAFLATSASAATIYSNDFDTTAVIASGISVSGGTTTSGGLVVNTETAVSGMWDADWSGNYFVNRTGGHPQGTAGALSSLTLTGLGADQEVDVSFTLGFLESWDSRGDKWSPDELDILVNSNVLDTLTTDHGNSSGGIVGANNVMVGAVYESVEVNSNMGWTDTLAQISFSAFADAAGELVLGIMAKGDGWQGGHDEAWGLDNLMISEAGTTGTGTGPDIPAVPVPAAVWLFGTAIAGLVGFRRRAKING